MVGTNDYCYDIERKLRPTPEIGWNICEGGGRPAKTTIEAGAERFRLLNSQRFGDKNPAKCFEVRKKISLASKGRPGLKGEANPRFGCIGSSRGKFWYHSTKTDEEMYFTVGEQPEGWVRGRKNLSPTKGSCWYHLPGSNERKFFVEGQQPEGWVKGTNLSSNKGQHWYHSPETKESRRFPKGAQPEGWVKGRLAATPAKGKFWYHNSINTEEKRFIKGNQPKGWIKGRKGRAQ